MAKSKVSPAERRERKDRAMQWKMFRRNHMFTQRQLAEFMGVSRRTIQQVESGRILPHPATLMAFSVFRRKHEEEQGPVAIAYNQ